MDHEILIDIKHDYQWVRLMKATAAANVRIMGFPVRRFQICQISI